MRPLVQCRRSVKYLNLFKRVIFDLIIKIYEEKQVTQNNRGRQKQKKREKR